MSVLEMGIQALELERVDQQIVDLHTYVSEIERWNRRQNLVRASGDDLVTRHILDSLTAVHLLKRIVGENPKTCVADIGSGAGLPGIPLAIFCPSLSFDLIERSQRRVAFLRNVVAVLGLSGVRIHEQDVNQVKERYRVVTFRAFRPLPESLELISGCLTPEAHILAYAGRWETVGEHLDGLPPLFVCQSVEPVRVPGLDAERHLVVIRYLGARGRKL